MLYYLFDYLDREFDLIGAGVFQYISFRAGMATLFSLLITIVFGKKLIEILQKKQVGESIRDLGLAGQMEKKGTPTMGGLIIIAAIVVPTLLFARLENIYVILLLVTTIALGAIGFIDDYIKVFKKNKAGLAGKFKVVGQVVVGLVVGSVLYFSDTVVVREFDEAGNVQTEETVRTYTDSKSTTTTIPFVKGNELDYSKLNPTESEWITAAIYILIVIFFVTAISNGANITDGIDGLAAGTSAIIGLALAILAYISGNAIFSDYLNVMFIPDSGELVIFCTAFVGACVGFLWYNSYPAQVFMGDTGSLSLGGVIAVLALVLRKELLIPVLCGIFVIENVGDYASELFQIH